MNLLRTAIFLCMVVYSVCQNNPVTDIQTESVWTSISTDTEEVATERFTDGPGSEATVTGESTSTSATQPATETDEVTSSQGSSFPEVSTRGNDTGTSTKTTGVTNHDHIITGTASPDDELTKETESITSTTDFNDGITNTVTTAKDAESNKMACSGNPCRNGGTCIDDSFNPYLFSCTCPAGYVGIRCGTVDKCLKDQDGELCKNGACIYSEDGLVRSCQCFAGTHWDEVINECREPDPPCFPNPCLNGGICSSEGDTVLCDCPSSFQGLNCSIKNNCGDCEKGTCVLDDKRTAKHCKCNEGYYWNEGSRTCEEFTSPCDLNPCHNGGTCDAMSDTEYNCTCQGGFSGRECEVIDMCSTDEDCGHGDCLLSENKTIQSCHCHKNFYLEEQSHTCKEITNVCQPNPCLNDGICTVLSTNAYNCTCSEGYIGKKCDTRDLCKMNGGNAYCRNGLCGNDFEHGLYYCTCKDEEYFQYKKRKCVELDLCPLVKCDSTEKCSMGKCECKDNYKWNNNTRKCEADFCSTNPCPAPGMICQEGAGNLDYKCSCQEGYSFNGMHCNEVSCVLPSLNTCDQICSPKDNGYECSCNNEFDMIDNHTCSYTGNHICSNKTCQKGFCIKEDDLEVCLCPPGYVEIDGQCADICSSGRLPSGICPMDECEAMTEGGFRCKCEGKFTLSKDKATCMVRNVCQEKEIGWKTCTERDAKCMPDFEASEGFTCRCSKGQVQIEGGFCRDVCSIENNQRQCSIRGATCELDVQERMSCKCPPYFKPNERDGKCTQPADFSYLITLPLDRSTYLIGNEKRRSLDISVDYRTVWRDITITIGEMFADFIRANILSCKTASSYILCKVELQFATEPKTDLKRLETEDVCLTDGNSNRCLLPPALVLVKDRISVDVDIQPTNPCDEDIKNLVCGSETTCVSSLRHKSFNCSCNPGFFSRKKNYPFGNTKSFIEECADINECEEDDPCPANSNCLNTIGNYTCSCKPGFRSVKDASESKSQKCVEICNPNPCTHGECSTRGDHEFDCRCEAGYRGTFCNLQDENFKRARINTIIVGVVLGGILLITFILFAACISRLRKKKLLESSGHMYYNTAEMTERRRAEGGEINNAFQRE